MITVVIQHGYLPETGVEAEFVFRISGGDEKANGYGLVPSPKASRPNKFTSWVSKDCSQLTYCVNATIVQGAVPGVYVDTKAVPLVKCAACAMTDIEIADVVQDAVKMTKKFWPKPEDFTCNRGADRTGPSAETHDKDCPI